jgi:hypothetical protein
MGSNPTAKPVIDFAPDGFACELRVPLDTISPDRSDKTLSVIARHAGSQTDARDAETDRS